MTTAKEPSIKQRVDHVEAQGKTAQLEAANGGSVAGSQAAAGQGELLWLCPIEDRRGLDSAREGMMQGFPLGSYVTLVDYAGRLFRNGKAANSAELAGIFERLNCSAQSWQVRLEKLRGDRLLGRSARVSDPAGVARPEVSVRHKLPVTAFARRSLITGLETVGQPFRRGQ